MTLTYHDDLGRVEVSLSAIAVAAVRVQRSTNQLYWQTIRGGVEVVIDAGVAVLDDYEFPIGSVVHYRVLDINDLEGAALESDSITVEVGDCEVWLKGIRYALLNQQVTIADYSPLDRAGRVSVSPIQGRSFPVATTDIAGAFTFEMTFVTDTADQARKLDLSLAVGDFFYLQFPPDGNPRFPPKSMYVVVLGTRLARLGIDHARHLLVQFAEVAAPSPQIVSTKLTYGTVWRLYGDWTQLWNGEPSWRPLWDTVGSPDDLVVL